jgi:tRNA(Ile)-lysidine synthase TilS/MesJ
MRQITPVLQYRWELQEIGLKPHLVYYGLRNYPYHQKGSFAVNRKVAEIIHSFDGKTKIDDIYSNKKILELIDQGIVVDIKEKRKPPTKENYRECVKCVNNDFIIPGLEFDENGVCAVCQYYDKLGSGEIQSVAGGSTVTDEELIKAVENNKSRFDVLVLFTGGKDSSFLLWYLAKKLKLRVLACTWNMPFMNESTLENIKTIKHSLPEVEFIERTSAWSELQPRLKRVFGMGGVPCICNVLAYALFYPIAVYENIPFLMDGIEFVQTHFMSITTPIPKIFELISKIYHPSDLNKTLFFLKKMALPSKMEPKNDFGKFIVTCRESLEPMYQPLQYILKNKRKFKRLPVLKRLKSDEAYGSWDDVKDIITEELGWKAPKNQKGLLHTSCALETVKDYCQYQCFLQKKTTFIPQSIIEISAATYYGMIDKDTALMELQERGYYKRPEVLDTLLDRLDLSEKEAISMGGYLGCVFK